MYDTLLNSTGRCSYIKVELIISSRCCHVSVVSMMDL